MKKTFLTALVAVLALTACGTVGDGTPKNSCLTKAAAAEIAITESYESATSLLSSGTIDKATAKDALKYIDAADAAVNSAGKFCLIDEPKALDYLKAAGSLLIKSKTALGG